jgi:Tfp pilus assembly protein PilP
MTAMKLTTRIFATAITLVAGLALAAQASAQNADAIDNARSTAKSLQQQANDSNAAPSKPSPSAPAPAVKPAVIPGAGSQASASNHLQKVNVSQNADGVQLEIVSNSPVTPKVSKLSSPARLLVELPETVSTAPQNHIAVGSAGVKDVRIGTNDKTPPTTSVVVDLEQACTYDVTPESSGKFVLTLHTEGGSAVAASPAKAAPAASTASAKNSPAKASAPAVKVQAVTANTSAPAPAVVKTAAAKPQASAPAKAAAKTEAKAEAKTQAKTTAVAVKAAIPAVEPAKAAETAQAKPEEAKPEDVKKDDKKPEDKKWAMNGKRDPFFSPVVQQNGSGCSTGKKCLEIGNINLRGVVKSDSGFIAVVTNNLNKAYFLRENDPVFNGYVVKITGDSIVFQETVEDKLGKPFTREVVKRIFTPAV